MAEHSRGEAPAGLLPDLLEHGVAQIFGQHGSEARRRITGDQGHDDCRAGDRPAHRIDDPFQRVGYGQADRLAGQDQHQSDDNPRLQLALALRPQQRQEAEYGFESGHARLGCGLLLHSRPR